MIVGLLASVAAHAQNGTKTAPFEALSPPIIEVASFRVAPVAGVDVASRLVPKPGEVLRNRAAVSVGGANDPEVETRVQAGESWHDILVRLGRLLQTAAFSNPALPGQLSILPGALPGKFIRAHASLTSAGARIEYVVKADEAYTILINEDSLQMQPHVADPQVLEKMRADPAKASLFTATDAIGLPETIALQLSRIFAGDVDFHRELHQGYRCELVYEMRYRNGHIDQSGTRILAAEFFIGEKQFNAYYFADSDGKPRYFNETGKASRKIFLRSPVAFNRITSDYTLARFHPILGIWRAHRGLDYAAPLDAKVMAIADGVVEFVGTRAEYGNLVVLQHRDNRFATFYAHLNAFAARLAAGDKVERGQIIGFVGMTGLATGPHLHFEFHMIDALGNRVPVPPPDVLESEVLAAPGFTAAVAEYKIRLKVAESTNFVILD